MNISLTAVILSIMAVGLMIGSSLSVIQPNEEGASSPNSANILADDLYRKPVICLGFDDAFKTVYDVGLPILEANGLNATVYVTTDWIGDISPVYLNDILSASNLISLQDEYGWEIGSHGTDHSYIRDSRSDNELTAQFRDSKATLEAIGLDVMGFAYPGGVWSNKAVPTIEEYYSYSRAAGVGYNPYDRMLLNTQDWMYKLRSICIDGRPSNEIKENITRAITENALLVLFSHGVDDVIGCTSAYLSEIASYISNLRNNSQVHTTTLADAIRYISAPTETTHNYTYTIHSGFDQTNDLWNLGLQDSEITMAGVAGTNIASNPSMETNRSGDLPAYWYSGQSGTITATKTWESEGAYDGDSCLKTTVSAYTSGYAYWRLMNDTEATGTHIAITESNCYFNLDFWFKGDTANGLSYYTLIIYNATDVNIHDGSVFSLRVDSDDWLRHSQRIWLPTGASYFTLEVRQMYTGWCEWDAFSIYYSDVLSPNENMETRGGIYYPIAMWELINSSGTYTGGISADYESADANSGTMCAKIQISSWVNGFAALKPRRTHGAPAAGDQRYYLNLSTDSQYLNMEFAYKTTTIIYAWVEWYHNYTSPTAMVWGSNWETVSFPASDSYVFARHTFQRPLNTSVATIRIWQQSNGTSYIDDIRIDMEGSVHPRSYLGEGVSGAVDPTIELQGVEYTYSGTLIGSEPASHQVGEAKGPLGLLFDAGGTSVVVLTFSGERTLAIFNGRIGEDEDIWYHDELRFIGENTFQIRDGGVTFQANVHYGVAHFSMTSYSEWTQECEEVTTPVTFTLSGLDTNLGYKILQDESVIATGLGPSFSFIATGSGEFQIVEWYGKQVSSLVVLIVNMIGLGIIVTVLASYIAPIANDIKEKRPIKPEKLTQNLIRTVIFIVVASLMWGVLHSIAIG